MAVVLNWGWLCISRDIQQCLETYLIVTTGGRCYWHLVGSAPKHPAAHRTVPTAKSYSVPHVSSAKVEKLCLRSTREDFLGLIPRGRLVGRGVCVFSIWAGRKRWGWLHSQSSHHSSQAFNTPHPCQNLGYPALKFLPSNMYEMTFIVVLIFIFLIIKELVTLSLTPWEAKVTHSWKAGNLLFCLLWNFYLVSLNISFLICKI